MEQNETTIEVGACYRDPGDGEIVRVLLLDVENGGAARVRTIVSPEGTGVRSERWSTLDGYERVPDPTPAVIDDEPAHDEPAHDEPAHDEPAHDEAAQQERIDATARAIFVGVVPTYTSAFTRYGDTAYEAAESLEAARERYIAARRKRTA